MKQELPELWALLGLFGQDLDLIMEAVVKCTPDDTNKPIDYLDVFKYVLEHSTQYER